MARGDGCSRSVPAWKDKVQQRGPIHGGRKRLPQENVNCAADRACLQRD